MKQIKTVICSIKESDTFDEKVNEHLKNGWELTKRDFIDYGGLTVNAAGIVGTSKCLYAELELEAPEEIQTCETCRFRRNLPHQAPCDVCNADADKWEPIPKETEKE